MTTKAATKVPITCRFATASDYDAVIGILPDLYGGRDSLPERYMNCTRDPLRLLFLAEQGNRVVAFLSIYVVDNKTRMLSESGRVVSDLQNTGIMSIMWKFVCRETLSRFPEVRHDTWTSGNQRATAAVIKAHPATEMLAKRPVRSSIMTPNKLKEVVNSSTFVQLCDSMSTFMDSTRVLPPSEALDVLEHGNMRRDQLVPENLWVVRFTPYGFFSSNYPLILKDSMLIMTKDQTGQVVAVSFGTYLMVKLGQHFHIDFYSANNARILPLMKAHVLKHLILLNQQNPRPNGRISFEFVMPQGAPKHVLAEFLSELGMPVDEVDKNNEHICMCLSLPVDPIYLAKM